MHTERAQLKLDATAVYTALGVNERLFVCSSNQVEHLVSKEKQMSSPECILIYYVAFVFLFFLQTPLKEQQGPEQGTTEILEQMGSKDIAAELTNYDWELFTAMHEVPNLTADFLSCTWMIVWAELQLIHHIISWSLKSNLHLDSSTHLQKKRFISDKKCFSAKFQSL